MEAQTQSRIQNKQHPQRSKATMKKSTSRNSESSAHADSPHSPLRFHSPRSDAGDPPDTPPYESPVGSLERQVDNSRAIVPHRSPLQDHQQKPLENANAPAKSPSSVMVFNRSMMDDKTPSTTKVGPAAGVGTFVEGGGGGGGGGWRSRFAPSTGRGTKKEEVMKSAALGLRVSEFVLCLISFSVMAADRTQGWSGDSFDRYKEYRYCLSVNVIAFVYSGFQAYDLAYHLVSGKHVIRHHLRRHFEFFMDQVLAYLLISASSSAATRVDDWQSNWGKDDFTKMASASVGMSFLAFVAFAISSLISGYNLWNPDSV